MVTNFLKKSKGLENLVDASQTMIDEDTLSEVIYAIKTAISEHGLNPLSESR